MVKVVVQLRLKVLQVLKCEIIAQDDLVEGPGEVTLQKLSIKDTLGHHSSNELEVVQMVLISNGRPVVREVTNTVVGAREEKPLLSKHLLGETGVKISG